MRGSKTIRACLSVLSLAAFAGGCAVDSSEPAEQEADLDTLSDAVVTDAAAATPGEIPNSLPARLMFGVAEGANGSYTNLASSIASHDVPLDLRYQYFVKGWHWNWGHGCNTDNVGYWCDGMWAKHFFDQSDRLGLTPVATLHEVDDFRLPDGTTGEGRYLQKVQTVSIMREYFTHVSHMMRRAVEFGKPVVLHIEPDGFGFLQSQASAGGRSVSDALEVRAEIASTGVPGLAGLPNTVRGFGLAFLKLRQHYNANNVILGIHVSRWGGSFENIQDFISGMGVGPNATGDTYDLLLTDVSDRDANFYVREAGRPASIWWDDAEYASFADWLRRFSDRTQRRWLLWQVPLGNSASRDVRYSAGSPGSGYKDNRTEYFFDGASADAHRHLFADSGVLGVLFGAGNNWCATQTTDHKDGSPYFFTQAKRYYEAGPLPLDAVRYDFEQSPGDWSASGPAAQVLGLSDAHASRGAQSLQLWLKSRAGLANALVSPPRGIPGGTVVSFRIRVPSPSNISSVQAFAMQGASWAGNVVRGAALSTDRWMTVSVTVPAGWTAADKIGIQVDKGATARDTQMLIDEVSWR